MNRNRPKNLGIFNRASFEFSTLGPVGSLPAPGTWSSLLATAISPWCFLNLPVILRAIVLILIFVLGVLAADRTSLILHQRDPSSVTIDEFFGQWTAFMPFSILNYWQLAIGFLFFRIFDIWKPWPIRGSENWTSNGVSIMVDDLLAAIYAAACLVLISLIFQWI